MMLNLLVVNNTGAAYDHTKDVYFPSVTTLNLTIICFVFFQVSLRLKWIYFEVFAKID